MYMYLCVCIYVYVCMYLCVFMYICICVYVIVYMCLCISFYVYEFMYNYELMFMYLCLCIYDYICIYQQSPKCGNCIPARRKSKNPWILAHHWFSPLILPPLADSRIPPLWASFLLMSLCPGVASAKSCTSHMSAV